MLRARFLAALVAVFGLAMVSGRTAGDPPDRHPAKPFNEVREGAGAKQPAAQGKAQGKEESRGKHGHLPAKKLPPGTELRTGGAAIERALRAPVKLDVQDVPLEDAVNLLKEQCGVEIVLDNHALADVAIGSDTPVTVNLHRVPLRALLSGMLRDLNLTWIIRNDVLMITTIEKADEELDTRVLDVADLVVCRDEHDVLWDDYEPLMDIITSTIRPTSWEEVGGPGAIRGASLGGAKLLVVSQTQEAHELIADLLKQIRDVIKKTPNAMPPRHDRHPPTPAKAAVIGGMAGGAGGGSSEGTGGAAHGGMGGAAPGGPAPDKPAAPPGDKPAPKAGGKP